MLSTSDVAEMFLAVESLVGFWKVNVTEKRTKIDWAKFIKELMDEVYSHAQKLTLVLDNLNAHKISFFMKPFKPRRRAELPTKLGYASRQKGVLGSTLLRLVSTFCRNSAYRIGLIPSKS